MRFHASSVVSLDSFSRIELKIALKFSYLDRILDMRDLSLDSFTRIAYLSPRPFVKPELSLLNN